MSNCGKPWLNDSGCPDPTAYSAIRNITAEEQKVDDAAHNLVTSIKNILNLCGFELVERIQIRHKKSGRIYK